MVVFYYCIRCLLFCMVLFCSCGETVFSWRKNTLMKRSLVKESNAGTGRRVLGASSLSSARLSGFILARLRVGLILFTDNSFQRGLALWLAPCGSCDPAAGMGSEPSHHTRGFNLRARSFLSECDERHSAQKRLLQLSLWRFYLSRRW